MIIELINTHQLIETMAYAVKEMYYTLQGEGAHTGRPAVFLRFAGCNLWSGLEKDRESAICTFCDTDFVGMDGPAGGRYNSAQVLAEAARALAPESQRKERLLVVCTGGEPLLQLDAPLVSALHRVGFEVAIETNGTLLPPKGVDWICVSPKAGAEQILREGHELKVVFPQEGLNPEDLATQSFQYFYIQPMDGPEIKRNTLQAIAYCLEHPQWRLSVQTHKAINIP